MLAASRPEVVASFVQANKLVRDRIAELQDELKSARAKALREAAGMADKYPTWIFAFEVVDELCRAAEEAEKEIPSES
jgi:hypothetical protein